MKRKLTTLGALTAWTALAIAAGAILIGNVTPVWAATTGRKVDNSNLFVWIFLCFCALIVIVQLIPAVMVLLGFTKGIKNKTPEAVPKNR